MAEALIVDNRAAMGDTPGLHALVIGIGRYPGLPEVGQQGKPHQFGLTSVDGPAVAAWRLSRTLQTPSTPPAGASWRQPLKTLRLLISPTITDLSRMPELVTTPAVLPNVAAVNATAAAWREDCERSEDEVALFYFTGHGLLHEGEDCLACADFGLSSAPGNVTLRGSFTLDSLFGALAGPRPGGWPIARRQFWFVDACRIRTSGATEGKIRQYGGAAQPARGGRYADGTCRPARHDAWWAV